LALIKKEIVTSDSSLALKALEYCQKNRLYAATEFCDVLRSYNQTKAIPMTDLADIKILTPIGDASFMIQYEPQMSNINDYQTLIR
jgi:hypothetical protein